MQSPKCSWTITCKCASYRSINGAHAFDRLGVVVLQVEGHRDAGRPCEAVRPRDDRPRPGRRPDPKDAAPSCAPQQGYCHVSCWNKCLNWAPPNATAPAVTGVPPSLKALMQHITMRSQRKHIESQSERCARGRTGAHLSSRRVCRHRRGGGTPAPAGRRQG